MTPAGLEPTIPAIETYALDRAATGTGPISYVMLWPVSYANTNYSHLTSKALSVAVGWLSKSASDYHVQCVTWQATYSTHTKVDTEISRCWIIELRNLKLSHCVDGESSSVACAAVVADVSNDLVAFIFSSQRRALATLLLAWLQNVVHSKRPPLWSSGQSFWLQIQRSRVRLPAVPDFSE